MGARRLSTASNFNLGTALAGSLDISAASIFFEPVGRFIGNPVSCPGFCFERIRLNLLAVRERDTHVPSWFGGVQQDRLEFHFWLATSHVPVLAAGRHPARGTGHRSPPR